MPDAKISALTEDTTPERDDTIVLRRGSSNYRTTLEQALAGVVGHASTEALLRRTGTAEFSTSRLRSTTTNPTVDDDSGEGYGLYSLWINTSTAGVWICRSAAPGAASWVRIDSLLTTAAGEIAGLTEKATPHADDHVLIEDSEASNAKKRTKISALGGGSSGPYTVVQISGTAVTISDATRSGTHRKMFDLTEDTDPVALTIGASAAGSVYVVRVHASTSIATTDSVALAYDSRLNEAIEAGPRQISVWHWTSTDVHISGELDLA